MMVLGYIVSNNLYCIVLKWWYACKLSVFATRIDNLNKTVFYCCTMFYRIVFYCTVFFTVLEFYQIKNFNWLTWCPCQKSKDHAS